MDAAATPCNGAASGEASLAKDTRLTELIIYKHEAKKTIRQLESIVARLRGQQGLVGEADDPLFTSDSNTQASNVEQIASWNSELVHTIENLQKTLLTLEANSNAQTVLLTNEVAAVKQENDALHRENKSLKARVADDILRQRQTNRIEVAIEKAKSAARVREAGRKRLEYMEGQLMEARDDLYFIQRWDAFVSPQRDVSFVFHYVSNVENPWSEPERLVMNVYQQTLRTTARRCHGYAVCSVDNMEIFAFQSPIGALNFCRDCHEQLVQLSWRDRAAVPYFSPIVEGGTTLFRGPRIHTCIFACTPESTIDVVSGRTAYFGPEVKSGVEAALELSAVGETVVNDKWAKLACTELRLTQAIDDPVQGDVTDLRRSLGSQWDVVAMPGTRGIICSILPASLVGRRSVQIYELAPTPKYPTYTDELAVIVDHIVKTMREGERESILKKRTARTASLGTESTSDDFEGAKLMQYYALQQEFDDLKTLHHNVQKSCEALERIAMESEDRYVISKRKPLDPSETAFFCTVDIGDAETWDRILSHSVLEDSTSVQNLVRSYVHMAAKISFGFWMNGNDLSVYTYAFRQVEQAVAFVSEVYIKVNRTGTKYSRTSQGDGQDVFLSRAGISAGSMSTIYSNRDNGILKCTGPAIYLSGMLCDLAQSGEVLAMEDVIQRFYDKAQNVIDAQYNVVKQPRQFLGSSDTPAVVHSILPKPFAYRRAKLMGGANQHKVRRTTTMAALMIPVQQYPRGEVEHFLKQQLEQMERMEEARMSQLDTFTDGGADQGLRNPWLLTSQPLISVGGKSQPQQHSRTVDIDEVVPQAHPLAFLFCDVVGLSSLTRDVPLFILQEVLLHYNYLVQEIFAQYNGYVAKTNSTAGYLVVFSGANKAIEAAILIQQRLNAAHWPDELRSAPATLYVRDVVEGVVLYNGLRAQVAVHYGNQYTWERVSPSEDSPPGGMKDVDVSGCVLEELLVLGQHTLGGQIRLSNSILEAAAKTVSGNLLLAQLDMQVLSTTTSVVIKGAARGTQRSFPKKRKTSQQALEQRRIPNEHSMKTVASQVISHQMITTADCVAAVPRHLAGRHRSLMPPCSAAESPDTGSAKSLTQPTTPSSEVASATPPIVAHASWCTDPKGCLSSLPVAAAGTWGVLEKENASTVVGREEVYQVQRLMEELLAAFPVRSPAPFLNVSSESAIASPVGSHLSLESTDILLPPTISVSLKTLSDRTTEEERHYETFIYFSRELINALFVALRVGNEHLRVPVPSMSPSPILNRTKAPSALSLPAIPKAPAFSRPPTGSIVPQPPGRPKKRNKVTDPYHLALDFLDEAMRLWVAHTGHMLRKSAINSAVSAKTKVVPRPPRRF